MIVKKFIAEFVGTFSMVFAGCGSIMVSERFPGAIPPGAVPLVFGLTVAAMIYSLGHISGAHFNPAVSLAFAVSRHFPRRELFSYWASQFLGATLASFVLWAILPQAAEYGTTAPHVGILPALVWEGVLSFFLMFVIIAVATDTRAIGTMAGAAIGAIVTVAAVVGGPVTGASLNPARSLAPAIIAGNFESLWIYFLGPCVGTVLAALTYTYIRCDTSAEPKVAKGCC